MKARYFRISLLLLLVVLVGCTGLPISQSSGGQPSQTVPVLPTDGLVFNTPEAPSPVNPQETAMPTQSTHGMELRVWVPPEFSPLGSSPASALLQSRLDQFTAQNPDIKLDVRIKDLEGEGGMLESLVATSVAAPLALPDLVLLPRPILESATLKGLLYPYDGLTTIMDDPNWYEYARQMARVQSGTYGIPFAGDALTLAYHPSLLETPPADMETALSSGEVMLFPATDPQALAILNTYLAEGGSLQDEQGRPMLDEAVLTRVLDLIQRSGQAGVMPYWLTQYSTDGQIWEAFLGNPYPMAITWASSYLNPALPGSNDLALAPIPTLSGQPDSLATGWSWALAGQDPERRANAVKLAEFLTEKDFMAQWTSAAGYLPPRADALQGWQDTEQRLALQQISTSAHLMPPVDLISSLGPVLQQAVVDVLKAQSDPQAAAAAAISSVNQP